MFRQYSRAGRAQGEGCSFWLHLHPHHACHAACRNGSLLTPCFVSSSLYSTPLAACARNALLKEQLLQLDISIPKAGVCCPPHFCIQHETAFHTPAPVMARSSFSRYLSVLILTTLCKHNAQISSSQKICSNSAAESLGEPIHVQYHQVTHFIYMDINAWLQSSLTARTKAYSPIYICTKVSAALRPACC